MGGKLDTFFFFWGGGEASKTLDRTLSVHIGDSYDQRKQQIEAYRISKISDRPLKNDSLRKGGKNKTFSRPSRIRWKQDIHGRVNKVHGVINTKRTKIDANFKRKGI